MLKYVRWPVGGVPQQQVKLFASQEVLCTMVSVQRPSHRTIVFHGANNRLQGKH